MNNNIFVPTIKPQELSEWRDETVDNIEKMFLKEKYHSTMFFVHGKNKEGQTGILIILAAPEVMDSPNSKDALVDVVKKTINDDDFEAQAIIFVSEAWMLKIPADSDERIEVINIIFETTVSQDMIIFEIKRDGDNVSLDKTIDTREEGNSGHHGGRFSNILKPRHIDN